MSERAQVSIDNAVATVRLSRPDKLNALDADMFDALIAAGNIEQGVPHIIVGAEQAAMVFCLSLLDRAC